MQSRLLRRLFHRRLSNSIQAYSVDSLEKEPAASSSGRDQPPQLPTIRPVLPESELGPELEPAIIMPKTIRELLTDARATEPRYVRLHNSNYSARDLLSEVLSMANRIVRRVSEAQMSSADRRWWPIREIASKWDSIKAYPEMLQGADVELLKILVLDAYNDLERLSGS